MTTDRILTGNVIDTDTASRQGLLTRLPVFIIAGCALFNFTLCFINTMGFGLSESHIILSEMTLVSLAAAYGFYRPDRERYFWLFVLIAQFLLLALLSVLRDEPLIKAYRDVMIMPIFIALGLASAKINFSKPLLWLSAFIGAVALFEAFYLDIFTDYFNIQDYYIAKGYNERAFEYIDGELFISGIRPGGRFFWFPIEIHRISSVFLEPVSLGFYAFISGLYFIAMKDRLPKIQVALAILLTMLLIWLGDARMAFASLVMVLLFRPIFGFLDHRLTIFMFPAALLFGLFVIESGLFYLGGQGLGARILWTFNYLGQTGEGQFFGTRPYSIEMVDSGFLYIIASQGIWGFLLYWLAPIFFKDKLSKEARIFWFGAAIFLTSGLMISNAIFTIKTASLLWFGYGYIIARTRHQQEQTEKKEVLA